MQMKPVKLHKESVIPASFKKSPFFQQKKVTKSIFYTRKRTHIYESAGCSSLRKYFIFCQTLSKKINVSSGNCFPTLGASRKSSFQLSRKNSKFNFHLFQLLLVEINTSCMAGRFEIDWIRQSIEEK
jgi:hypothetical protein